MPARSRRPLLPCLSLLLVLASPAFAQGPQSADKEFNAKVAHPMFVTRHPNLLFDEGHNNTHTTQIRYDALAQLAVSDGFEVMTDNNKFSHDDLKDANILVIANAIGVGDPRKPEAANPAFTSEECKAVHAWVEAGGSLLLVAEHAPMGVSMRPLAQLFGVDLSTGFTVDSTLADTSFGASTLVFSAANKSLGEHVIIRGRGPAERVKRVRTYTGESLMGPPGSVELLMLSPVAQDLMLGMTGTPGVIPDSLKRSAAGRAQAVAFTLGKGRVVMVGESAVFSAQLVPGPGGVNRKVGMNSPGFDNRQLALNVLRWLARGLN